MTNYAAIVLALLLCVAAIFSRRVIQERAALIIIDVQYCFLPGGSLAVAQGEKVIPIIKKLRSEFRDRWSLVVMTQDWHCSDHVSFASQHPGYDVYSSRNLSYNQMGELCDVDDLKNKYAVKCISVAHTVQQTLWPDHCVKYTQGANISSDLSTNDTDLIVRKGYNCQIDSYSAFYDNGGFEQTELHEKLQAENITSIYVTGLARDYCVYYTALDGLELGYKTYVVVDATRGVAEGTSIAAIADMQNKGVHLLDSAEVKHFLPVKLPEDRPEKAAFIIIDVQNCFLPGGSLAVAEGDQVVGVINNVRSRFSKRFHLVVMSQDWHCADHVSFASQHHNVTLMSQIFLDYDSEGHLCTNQHVRSDYRYAQKCPSVHYRVQQTMWPDHCVLNTTGAEFSSELATEPSDVVIRKGTQCHIDSYSVFYDNGGFAQTELHQKLKKHNITTVYVAGLARDYCVYRTALDAKILGYKTLVILDATRGVDVYTSEKAVEDMKAKGIYIISSEDIDENLPKAPSGKNNGPVSSGTRCGTEALVALFGTLVAFFINK